MKEIKPLNQLHWKIKFRNRYYITTKGEEKLGSCWVAHSKDTGLKAERLFSGRTHCYISKCKRDWLEFARLNGITNFTFEE
jgi:hypothetical protein